MSDMFAERLADIPCCSGRPFTGIARCLPSTRLCRRSRPRALCAAVRKLFTEPAALPETEDESMVQQSPPKTKSKRLRHRSCHQGQDTSLSCGAGADGGGRCLVLLTTGVALCEVLGVLLPEASFAGETLPVEVLSHFLVTVEQLGVYGPVVFVATVIGAEMVPLFPTQPLSIASGLLFGASKGSLLALAGTSTAAVLAFQLSRRVGKRLAQRIIAEEISEEDRKGGMFSGVQDAIDSGSFQQQLLAVTLLRLTPVVPFSASNYLLGATPLKFGAYLAGSVLGLSFWCVLFASLGGASRDVLKNGLSLEELYGDILAKAGSYTEEVAAGVAVVATAALLYYKFGPQGATEGGSRNKGEWR